MRKFRFKSLKLENIFRNVVCNVVITILLLTMFLFSFNTENNQILQASNSEYNGTIYAGDKSSNKVSLMINVYWGTEFVEKFLYIFDKYQIKTTFFVGGTWANSNSELLKKIYSSGHEIANHGNTHKEHGKLGYDSNYDEISKCHKIVKDILGIEMELFAPPGGSYNSNTIKAASDLGYKTIMWTRDTIDWRDHYTNLIYNRAVTLMTGGDLILMHPTECTIQATEKIIEYAINHNLKLTTVSDTLGLNC